MDTTSPANLPAVVPAPATPQVLDAVAVGGDLSGLTVAQRLAYYKAVCQSLGLNPLTKPFEYLTLNGKPNLAKISWVIVIFGEQERSRGVSRYDKR